MKKIIVTIVLLAIMATIPAFAVEDYEVQRFFGNMKMTTVMSENDGSIVVEMNDDRHHSAIIYSDRFGPEELSLTVLREGEVVYSKMMKTDYWDVEFESIMMGIYYGLL